jgi:hypothetical protein
MADDTMSGACGAEITIVDARDRRSTRPCSHQLPCPWHGGRFDDVVACIHRHVRSVAERALTATAALELIKADVGAIMKRRSNQPPAL